MSVEGCTYCARHGANKQLANQESASIRTYQLARWRHRLDQLSDDPKIKSLREEIGILRMSLEAVVDKCKDSEDLFMFSNKIGELVLKIEKLVTSCHRLEAATGQLLDRSAALHFAATVVEIISGIINSKLPPDVGEGIIDAISNAIIQSLATLEVPNKEGSA